VNSDREEERSGDRAIRRETSAKADAGGNAEGQRAAASHAKQKSLSLRLNMIPHLLSMY
jgi:hypothetical protein